MNLDDRPPMSRLRRGLHAVKTADPLEAMKWAACGAGGGVALVAVLVAIETIVRWVAVPMGWLLTLLAALAGWIGAGA